LIGFSIALILTKLELGKIAGVAVQVAAAVVEKIIFAP
tara:strand:- start:420 stop:533 length:114 start_codon:yes stop_codon:yes gene_type:complete